MLNQLLNNIIAAPIRIGLLVFIFFVLHQVFTRQQMSNYNYRFFLSRFSIYGAVVLIIMFILVQMNMYHIFSLLLLLSLFVCFSYFNFKEFITYTKSGGRFRQAALIVFFRFVEKTPSYFSKNFKKHLKVFVPKKIDYTLLLVLFISVSAVFARIFFIENDEYTFSSLWLQKLQIIKNFDNNEWFAYGQNIAVGELALINLFANLIGVSKEMAVFTFGLFETFLITAYIFYVVNALTKSEYLGPLIAGVSFACLFTFLPLNINTLFQHSSIYFGFIFAFPLMIYVLLPDEYHLKRFSYFKVQTLLSVAIALTNFYVMFIVLPIFLISAFSILPINSSLKKTFLAYLFGGVSVLLFEVIMCHFNKIDFLGFFLGNIIAIDSYSHIPQLLFPENQLNIIYLILGFISLIGTFILMILFKDKMHATLTFTIFYISLLFLKFLNISWLDEDLLKQSFTILIPIIVGIIVVQFNKIVKLLGVYKNVARKAYLLYVLPLIMGLVFFGYPHDLKQQSFKDIDELKVDLLKVYDQLSSYQMKNTYAVVNENYGIKLSGNEHIFISQKEFLENYLKRDSIYQKIKNNKNLLMQNQEHVLPNSVFVFVSDTIRLNHSDKLLKTSGKTALALKGIVNVLQERGNLVNTYFKSENLIVYEIVNTRNGSNLNDMIFAYENNK